MSKTEKSAQTKKKRAKNYTEEEQNILLKEVTGHSGILFGPLKGPKLTQHHRDMAWTKIQNLVNAVAPCHRSIEDIRNKWKDLKNRTKEKANRFKRESLKTGGGDNPAPPLTPLEELVLAHVGVDSVEGIKGGVDTLRKKTDPKPTTATASCSSSVSVTPTPPVTISPPVTFSPVYSPIPSPPAARLIITPHSSSPDPVSPPPKSPPQKTIKKKKTPAQKKITAKKIRENETLAELKKNNAYLRAINNNLSAIKELKEREIAVLKEMAILKKKKYQFITDNITDESEDTSKI